MTFPAVQDPDAVLDWTINWSRWLGATESIVAAEWTADSEDHVTLSADVFGATTTTVWVEDLVAGQVAMATCHITTSEGREDDRTIRFVPEHM